MMTINALCLPTLPDMIEKILQARTLFGENFATMSYNILRFPSFQSCLVLPQDIKDDCVNRLKQLDLTNMQDWERGQLDRLIEYLQVVETPHSESFEMPKLHNDFKKFYSQYDVRRLKDFSSAFPTLKNWYETL
jgi:hypothetical protein